MHAEALDGRVLVDLEDPGDGAVRLHLVAPGNGRVPLALRRSEEELTDLLLERTGGRMAPACETFPQACTAVQCGSGGALLLTLDELDLPARRVKGSLFFTPYSRTHLHAAS